MKKGVVYASCEDDQRCCVRALELSGCTHVVIVRDPSEIPVDLVDMAIVEAFDGAKAHAGIRHAVETTSIGISIVRALRDRHRLCVILALTNTNCENDSALVEGKDADWTFAINWSQSTDVVALLEGALRNAVMANDRLRVKAA